MNLDYSSENKDDWRIEVLQSLEKDICGKANTYYIEGLDPHDVAQELRLKVWNSLVKYNPDKAGYRTYAVNIMRNHLVDMNRRASRKKRSAIIVTIDSVYCIDDHSRQS